MRTLTKMGMTGQVVREVMRFRGDNRKIVSTWEMHLNKEGILFVEGVKRCSLDWRIRAVLPSNITILEILVFHTPLTQLILLIPSIVLDILSGGFYGLKK